MEAKRTISFHIRLALKSEVNILTALNSLQAVEIEDKELDPVIALAGHTGLFDRPK